MTSLSAKDIPRLKRQAKQTSGALGITHTAALDQIATENGFNNWALFQRTIAQCDHPQFLRTPDEMKRSFRKSSDYINADIEDKIRRGLPDLSCHYSSPLNALQYAEALINAALSMPRYSPHSCSVARYEMRIYLPYCLEPLKNQDGTFILLGRDYKPLGMPQRNDLIIYEDFKNLHVNLPPEEVHSCTRNPHYSPGYLYDGIGLHSNRKHAEAYHKQLRIIMDLVSKHSSP